LTRSFNALMQRHVAGDLAFSVALVCEGIDTMLAGGIGKAILRDHKFRENADDRYIPVNQNRF